MGGNALKNTNTRRYQKDEYFALFPELVDGHLFPIQSVLEMYLIEAYRDKESFGDMDIIYSTFDDVSLDIDDIKTSMYPECPNEIIKNGDVISFDYKELQIDMIHSKKETIQYVRNYMKANDLGNLIGRIAKKFGLKHGHRGLTLPVRNGDHVHGEIVINMDHDKTLEFLGLDAKKFNDGFDSLDDIFQFVSSSQYYNPEFYKLENLNTIAKVRDRKRTTYREFLKFGETYSGPVWNPNKDKSYYLPMIFEAFPDAREQFVELMKEVAFSQAYGKKFNGVMVKEITGLEGKELGIFMKKLKDTFWFYPEFVVYSEPEKIRNRIIEIFEQENSK